mgnify:CR=1 FL=1
MKHLQHFIGELRISNYCNYVFVFLSECIRFALTPLFKQDDPTQPGPNILFLEVLPEFASKLLKPDKKAIYDHIDKLVHNASIDADAWQPLINYRRILNDEPGGGHGQKARLSTATRGRKRAAPQDGKIHLIYS